MSSSGANSQKEDVFKAVESPKTQSADIPESRSGREDSTAGTEVKAPGVVERVAEEVQAIAGEIWAAITPGSKK